MREDFKKVLCECYKEGSGSAITSKHIRSKVKQSRNDEDGLWYSSKGRERKIISYNSKSFGENLNPLLNYLHAQVGRPWNKVFSEIKKVNQGGGAVSNHIFQHLFDFICLNVIKKDGKVYSTENGVRELYSYRSGNKGALYVDPKDGIIKLYKTKKKKYRRRKEEVTVKVIDNIEYRKIDGIWYLCRFDDVPAGFSEYTIDGVTHRVGLTKRCLINGIVTRESYRKYCSVKNQLNSKELARLKLVNDSIKKAV